MKLITKQEYIQGVADRFKRFFTGPNELNNPDLREAYKKLLALNPITVEGIDAITKNDNWTWLACQVCYRNVDLVVHLERIDQPYNEDHIHLNICPKCLTRGLDMVKEASR